MKTITRTEIIPFEQLENGDLFKMHRSSTPDIICLKALYQKENEQKSEVISLWPNEKENAVLIDLTTRATQSHVERYINAQIRAVDQESIQHSTINPKAGEVLLHTSGLLIRVKTPDGDLEYYNLEDGIFFTPSVPLGQCSLKVNKWVVEQTVDNNVLEILNSDKVCTATDKAA